MYARLNSKNVGKNFGRALTHTFTHSLGRTVGAALPLAAALVATLWAPHAAAQESSDGPRYTYLGLGYEWADVVGGVKQEGGEHEGIKVDASLGLFESGNFDFHLAGSYFDGDFTGLPGADQDSKSYEAGLGASYSLSENYDFVGQIFYLNSELEGVDDDGLAWQALFRGLVTENVELEAGFRYEELDDSDISNNDIIVGLNYGVTDDLFLRVSGVVFDDDTGFELGVRYYFGGLMGRDFVF